MFARQIVNEQLSQVAYLIGCQKTGEAILIDPLRDVEQYVKIAEENKLKLVDAYNLIPKDNKNFVDTVHFTPDGMKLLAKNISEHIKI